MTKAATWTDELKQEAVAMYQERMEAMPEEDRPKFSMEVVNEISQELEKTPNSVRSILLRAEVYIKKASAPKATKASGGGKKMSKADAQAELLSALQDGGAQVDDELTAQIEKMTGKAAQLLAVAIRTMGDDE